MAEASRIVMEQSFWPILRGSCSCNWLANALQNGVSNEQVGDVLMSSAEYFARV
jgi:hypothetical protein